MDMTHTQPYQLFYFINRASFRYIVSFIWFFFLIAPR